MLTNPQQLLCPPLIRGKSSNLTDQVAHKLVVLGQLALENVKVEHKISGKNNANLGVAGLWLEGVWGGLVPLLQTHADLVPGCHPSF